MPQRNPTDLRSWTPQGGPRIRPAEPLLLLPDRTRPFRVLVPHRSPSNDRGSKDDPPDGRRGEVDTPYVAQKSDGPNACRRGKGADPVPATKKHRSERKRDVRDPSHVGPSTLVRSWTETPRRSPRIDRNRRSSIMAKGMEAGRAVRTSRSENPEPGSPPRGRVHRIPPSRASWIDVPRANTGGRNAFDAIARCPSSKPGRDVRRWTSASRGVPFGSRSHLLSRPRSCRTHAILENSSAHAIVWRVQDTQVGSERGGCVPWMQQEDRPPSSAIAVLDPSIDGTRKKISGKGRGDPSARDLPAKNEGHVTPPGKGMGRSWTVPHPSRGTISCHVARVARMRGRA